MNWNNGTFVRGYVKHGILIGAVRHFSKTGHLTSITEGLTSNAYLTLLNDLDNTSKHYRLGKISSPIFLPQETSTCFIQFFGFSRHLGLI